MYQEVVDLHQEEEEIEMAVGETVIETVVEVEEDVDNSSLLTPSPNIPPYKINILTYVMYQLKVCKIIT